MGVGGKKLGHANNKGLTFFFNNIILGLCIVSKIKKSGFAFIMRTECPIDVNKRHWKNSFISFNSDFNHLQNDNNK